MIREGLRWAGAGITGAAGAIVTARRGHPGWFGLVGGALAGIVLATLALVYLRPLLAGPDEPEPGELVVLSGRDDSVDGQRQALVDQWNLLHPDSPARIVELSGLADAQRSEMVARAQAGDRAVDVYNLDVTWMAEFRAAGYIRPLDPAGLDLSGFLDKPLQTCQDGDGRLWGLPFNTDAGLLFYRTDLVGNPPTSWAGLTDAVQQVLSRPPANGPLAGYTGQFADYEGLTVNALEAIWAAGGEVVDESGNVVIDSDEVRSALARLAQGLARSTPQLVLPESTGFDEPRSTQAFGEGKTVFMRNWPVAYRTLDAMRSADGAADGAAARHLAFDVARLPGPSVLGGQNLAIASKTKRPRAAQRLIEFLTSERSQQILFERGGFAATREIVYQDPVVRRQYRYAPILLQAIRAARPRPVLPRYAQFSEEFRRIVLAALGNGGQLPADAADRLRDARDGYRR